MVSKLVDGTACAMHCLIPYTIHVGVHEYRYYNPETLLS